MNSYQVIRHHGIKGQKWGVRRYQNEDGSLTTAGKKRYSSEQFDRDRSVYGKRAAKRIQRKVEQEGKSVSTARSEEARRINATRGRAVTAGQVGSAVGSIAGGIGGYLGGKAVSSVLASSGNLLYRDPQVEMMISVGVAGLGSKLGSSLGRYGGRSAAMIGSGYSPSKFRYAT